MKRFRSVQSALLAILALAWSVPAFAVYPGSCANGQAIFYKKVGAIEVSCSQAGCHKNMAQNVLTGAANPGQINQFLDTLPAMAGLRGSIPLSADGQDVDDVATFLFYYPSACPSGGGTPNLQAAPSPVNFASTTVGATSATTTITITNAGTASALAVSATSSDPTHFPVTSNTCAGITVAAGGTCSFKVAFHPTAAGALNSNIVISRTGGVLTVGVSGTGGSVASPGQLSMNTSLAFGDQTINTTSAAGSINVTNIGGSTVSVSSVSSSNPAEFAVASSSCGNVVAGGSCSIVVTFTPGVTGARSASITVVSSGTGSPQAISASGTGTSVTVPPTTVTVVEYYHAPFDHYFITSKADEISILDTRVPPFQDWVRTGFTFTGYVNATAPAGSVAICRFFNDSPAFAPKSSHFYAPHGQGCEDTIASFPDWKLENDKLFNTMVPDAVGNCPAGTVPVYRMYNNGMGGAPNHRFVTSLAERQKMLNKGYVAEGKGIGVGMCVPP
ncbi:MAG TPA: choice-of-anchor D domain-containing protein [Casimicrobiaceae bacterium]|nr:choice-of-anchor D domain-containing protein [Casimicrobiaceae bacterium]